MPESPLWTPSRERIEAANLTAFLRETGFSNYSELHRWSVDAPDSFWSEVWNFVCVSGEMGEVAFDRCPDIWKSRFFPNARLNIAENFLHHQGGANPAIIGIDENGVRRRISWDELGSQVLAVAGALQSAGVGSGDRVAAWLPLIPEAVVLLLASSAIGATFSSTSPDFGVEGVVDRFGQIEPKVLVAATGYQYGGKWFDCIARLREICPRLGSLRQLVLVETDSEHGETFPDAISWHRWLDSATAIDRLQRFPFDQPWLVLYSSGTTGKPKCILHCAGGVFLNLKKEHILHCDVKASDRMMYFTTTGWMMFNWLVNGLAAGATIILPDGNPFYPNAERLLTISDQEHVTLLGVSAKYIDGLRKSNVVPRRSHSLVNLRCICSTGSPLSEESFAWLYSDLKADVHLASISGGTDICGCFLVGNPIEPVFSGELQRPGLGMAMDVFDANCTSLRDRIGAQGELVCTRPFPSKPLGFWNDAGDQLYQAAYFAKCPGVWAHGDFASWSPNGGMVIHGRSDATLNPGGVRIGTAEIYRVVEQIPDVLEALVFGQQWKGDIRIVLLVRLLSGVELSNELKNKIRQRIRSSYSPRHVPAVIAAVDDLPRTRSNKLVEVTVSDLVNGREVRNVQAIANPEALWAIAELPELKT